MEKGSYICIHCGSVLSELYEQYGGRHIRLSQCQHCNRVADKYIEYDNVLLFIDLILIKPCAYRHTIYNVFLASATNREKEDEKARLLYEARTNSKTSSGTKTPQLASLSESMDNIMSSTSYLSSKSNASIIPLVFRLGILMLLFEVYVTWAYQEKSFMEKPDHTSLIISLVLEGPIQYIYFLSVTLLQNLLLCLSLSYYGLRWLTFPTLTNPIPSSSSSFEKSITSSEQFFDIPVTSSPSPFSSRSPSPTPTFHGTRASQLRIPSLNNRDKLYSSTSSSSSRSPSPSPSSMINNSFNRSKISPLIDLTQRSEYLNSNLNFNNEKLSFKKLFEIMITTVLISNIIKLFPIVMLIWPYDPPILHATRFLVRIVHIFLLIEAVYIVLIDPKNNQRRINSISNSVLNSRSNNTVISSNDYYKVAAVVFFSELTRIIISHLIIVFFASAIWGVSVREICLDDWKMFKVGIKMLEELGDYILGEV
ncbi:sterol homeostasis protein [Pichia californica]|uniref:Protein ARV n=1 Tax=Pichia californica TaxID=460514 RepID=A0A9P7BE09_9ASCO|nr:sterol homeostasis protein [[Candida] californica]KAG0688757.1 sterol homeostasis protein [[Candida] californica]